jgi:hypothetical protein
VTSGWQLEHNRISNAQLDVEEVDAFMHLVVIEELATDWSTAHFGDNHLASEVLVFVAVKHDWITKTNGKVELMVVIFYEMSKERDTENTRRLERDTPRTHNLGNGRLSVLMVQESLARS